jgi:hypothetical protein
MTKLCELGLNSDPLYAIDTSDTADQSSSQTRETFFD